MDKLQSTIVTELIQSLTDIKGEDSKVAFLRNKVLDQMYYQMEPVQCYIIPYLDKVDNIVESIPPWTIEDTINSVNIEQIVPLSQNPRVSSVISPGFIIIGAVIGPITSHLKTPIGGQISASLVPSLDVATLERHGLIGSESEVEAIVALLKGRIKPVAGYIRPVISPVSPQHLRAIDGIVKLTPLALEMTTIMFPATTSTLRRSRPIIKKASKFIGAGIGVYRVISIFRR